MGNRPINYLTIKQFIKHRTVEDDGPSVSIAAYSLLQLLMVQKTGEAL
jgi:hypothetical protein